MTQPYEIVRVPNGYRVCMTVMDHAVRESAEQVRDEMADFAGQAVEDVITRILSPPDTPVVK